MRFVSLSNVFSINIAKEQKIVTPAGELIEHIPPLTIHFENRMYETQDKRIIRLLVALLYNRKQASGRLKPTETFFVHPEDKEKADEVWAEYVSGTLSPEIVDKEDGEKAALQEKIAELERQLAQAVTKTPKAKAPAKSKAKAEAPVAPEQA